MAGYLSARTGPRPEVRSFPTLTAELDFAADLVGSWVGRGDVAPETVAVLVRDRVTRDRVVAGLGERGVEVRALEAGTVKPGYPVALTMHRAKGTEFARVLLFGLSKDSMPMGLKAYDYDDEELSEAQLRLAEELNILRVKGHVAVAGKPMRMLVQAVGARVRMQFDRPWGGDARRSQLVVIAEHDDIDEAAIRKVLGA